MICSEGPELGRVPTACGWVGPSCTGRGGSQQKVGTLNPEALRMNVGQEKEENLQEPTTSGRHVLIRSESVS